ncbi:hypothetical protein [Actinoplanes awajinensis]|uniref:Uncharacterized protein n=1 Tax=Actinoplanes awajinensis subsp. mycoplanecinus TaxID=135947 RepID=A0A101J7S7_9ACTN|nr:hypothetical protein [Actinoplanes awajinensis]KUL21755.1 hypothetical protein ADL15_49875 [Actinoplanes awajinensis subsp. mycoplanecinus]
MTTGQPAAEQADGPPEPWTPPASRSPGEPGTPAFKRTLITAVLATAIVSSALTAGIMAALTGDDNSPAGGGRGGPPGMNQQNGPAGGRPFPGT